MIPYTKTPRGIVFFFQGKQHTISSDVFTFNDVCTAIIENNDEQLEWLIKKAKVVAKITFGKVSITDDDQVLYNGIPTPEYLANRIVEHYKEDPRLVEPLMLFCEKLMANPNVEIREDLFKWLERGNMPICSDGDFLAYKLVREDFSPIRQGGEFGHDQSPGQIVEMPRDKCNPNRNQTCSTGLHFCSYEYLPTFQSWNGNNGKKVILLKINPTDVTAIPTDYNLSKGRTCRFEVLQEIDFNTIKETFGDLLVYPSDEDNEEVYIDKKVNEPTKEEVLEVIAENYGNKTAAAKQLNISRKKLYRIIK